jgi:hypothetical protein
LNDLISSDDSLKANIENLDNLFWKNVKKTIDFKGGVKNQRQRVVLGGMNVAIFQPSDFGGEWFHCIWVFWG